MVLNIPRSYSNLYKSTQANGRTALVKQVVFNDRENKHDFVLKNTHRDESARYD